MDLARWAEGAMDVFQPDERAWMRRNGEISLELCPRGTPFGPVAVLWSIREREPKVYQILLSSPGGISADEAVEKLFPGMDTSSCPEIDRFLDQIEAFLSGEEIRFSLDRLCLDLYSPFSRRVLLADFAIPRGRVSTYRRIAEHLDKPGAARAVGTALARNPFPLIIPCHRVIRSDGSLGGFRYGLHMKRRLLEMEGVTFQDERYVAVPDFFYGGWSE